MSVHYFMKCNGRLFSTVYESKPIIITSWSSKQMADLERMMIHHHAKDRRITNRFESMRTSKSTKVDILEMSSYVDSGCSDSLSNDLQNMEMAALDIQCIYDWHQLDQLHKLTNSGLFVMRDFEYSEAEELLTLQGCFIESATNPSPEYDIVKFLSRNYNRSSKDFPERQS
jgi:hypothetical protein